MYGYSSSGALTGVLSAGIWAVLLAVAATVAICLLFMKKSKAATYQGFARKLYEFLDFRQFWLGKILKVLYIFTSVYMIISGVFTMFQSSFLIGLLSMLLGPVVARIAYEMLLLLFSLYKEVKQINDNTAGGAPRREDEPSPYVPPAPVPPQRPQPPQQPSQRYAPPQQQNGQWYAPIQPPARPVRDEPIYAQPRQPAQLPAPEQAQQPRPAHRQPRAGRPQE